MLKKFMRLKISTIIQWSSQVVVGKKNACYVQCTYCSLIQSICKSKKLSIMNNVSTKCCTKFDNCLSLALDLCLIITFNMLALTLTFEAVLLVGKVT